LCLITIPSRKMRVTLEKPVIGIGIGMSARRLNRRHPLRTDRGIRRRLRGLIPFDARLIGDQYVLDASPSIVCELSVINST
jgi:hypothetical protein